MMNGTNLGKAIIIGSIVCFITGIFLFGFLQAGIRRIWHTDNIESSIPIIPIKKLVINNNKVDTIYIYRKL